MKGLFCVIIFIGLIHVRTFICHLNPPPQLRCPSDTCPNNEYSDSEILLQGYRNCFCDHDCEIYGDCCFNIKRPIHISKQKGLTSCVTNPLTGFGTISMIIKCPSYWNDGDVRQACEQQNGDAFTNVPVTNNLTNRTYKNVDCAKCNEEDLQNLIYWNMNVNCPLAGPGYKFKNFLQILEMGMLEYNSINKWYLRINQTRMSCTIQLLSMNSNLRPCRQAISKCVKNWFENPVQTRCQMYTAYRYNELDGNFYKNYDCAKCNYISQPLLCEPFLFPVQPGGPGSPGGPSGVPGSSTELFPQTCFSLSCMYKPINPPTCIRKYVWSVKYKFCVTCNPLERFNGIDCILA